MKEALEAIARLYPEIPEEERQEAAGHLVHYLRVLLGIAENICADLDR
jgi:hypothetical protein